MFAPDKVLNILLQIMNLYQRQEQSEPTISGRKINNYFTCTVKEVKRLSPQLFEQQGRERNFQTDSFKQILTKRSGCPVNKENISTQNKALRKIKEEALNKQNAPQIKKKLKSNLKKSQKKISAVSLTKVYQRNRSANEQRKKDTKSVSPSRDLKDYRSGPIDKKNYLSNNITSKTKEVMPSRSEKSLTDRQKHSKSIITANFIKKQEKGDNKTSKKDLSKDLKLNKIKKIKNQSKISLNSKKGQVLQKTECIAKQFDSLLKNKKSHPKKSKKNKQQKNKKSKSKEKKIIVSHNNSKNFLSKHKLNSDFSNSHQSPQRAILSTRYEENKLNTKRTRLSFEPSRKKGKTKQKAKTEALSPQKTLENKNEAATIIQKVFRGYLTRKYISQFKNILLSVITIQRLWRGYKARKFVKQLKEKAKKQQIKMQKQKLSILIQKQRKTGSPQRENQLASLLEQILNQQNINQSIKNKISTFLKKQQNINSARSGGAKIHLQIEMRSQKRFFQQIDKKKYKFGSPLIKYSPKLQKSDLHKSPQIMIQNLMTIKQFQRQKLINNAKLQIEGLQNLTIRNIFSPRTRDVKKLEINKKLEQDLLKFDESITQVIKSCKQIEDIVGPIKPFSGHSTPQRMSASLELSDKNKDQDLPSPKLKQPQHKQLEQVSIEKFNSSQKKLQDLSMELLQYYEQKTQMKAERQYQKLDPSYQFIQQYLFGLFEFLRQAGRQYRQGFINIMRSNRNLQIKNFLQNLNLLTEDSDEDYSFKLPMYKYLENQQPQVISRKGAEQFNNNFLKLQRHQLGLRINVQDIYLKMILDALNEALNLERPRNYIFTETSITGRGNRMRILEIQALDGYDNDQNESQFSFYFANSMNHLYKWAHTQCGRRVSQQNNDEVEIMQLNQNSLKQFQKFQIQKQQYIYDELLQTIIALSNQIFEQIILEEGIGFYI